MLFEFFDAIPYKPIVKILATEVCISACRHYFEDAVAYIQDRCIKCAATQVENEYILLAFHALSHTVCQRRRIWLINDPYYLNTCNLGRIDRGLSLRVVKVGWNGDDGLCYLVGDIVLILVQEPLGHLLHLRQNEGRDLLGVEGFVFIFEFYLDEGLVFRPLDHSETPLIQILLNLLIAELHPNEPLRIANGVFGVSVRLIDGALAHQIAVLIERHLRRCRRPSLKVDYNFNFVVSPDANARISRAKINANGIILTIHFM